jgi:MFS family permease
MHQKRQVLLALAGLLPETLLDSTLTPLYPYIAKHFFPISDSKTISQISSLLASAFYLPLFISNTVWGALSDRIGRKICLVISMIVCLVTTVALSLSPSFEWAFSSRFIAGIFGAYSTVVKGMIGTIEPQYLGWGYAVYGSIFGISGILGPIIGGLLGNPAQLFGSWHKEFFQRFPLSLVGMISAASSLLIIPMFLSLVREDLGREHTLGEFRNEDTPAETLQREESFADETTLLITQDAQLFAEEAHPSVWNSIQPYLSIFTGEQLYAITLYGFVAMIVIDYMITIPLYLSTDTSSGGLGLTSQETAFTFTFLSLSKLLCQLLVFDRLLVSLQSPELLFAIGLGFYCPAFLAVPCISKLGIPLYLIMISLGVGECICYLSSIVMITKSSATLGYSHGISSTLAALLRATVPNICGYLWGVGMTMKFTGFTFVLSSFGIFLLLVFVITRYQCSK